MSKTTLVAIPLVFLVCGLFFGSRQFHWDTLERASLLEHPGAYLRTWDGSPRSQFLSFAHVLELPLAGIVRVATGFPSGLRSLIVFEALCAAVALFLLGRIVLARNAGTTAAWAAQATLACTWGFWKMGTSGEERILGITTALVFLVAYWRFLRTGRGSLSMLITPMLAVLCHLSNAVLIPFAFLGLWMLPARHRTHRRAAIRPLILGAVSTLMLYGVVAAWTTGVRTPLQFWNYLTFFHRDTGNDFFEVTASTAPVVESLLGLQRFFAEPGWLGVLATGLLAGVVLERLVRPRAKALRLEERHLMLLAGLWSLHFVFYEPGNIESWTIPVVGLILCAAWSRGRLLAGVAVLLLLGNMASFARLHEPMPYHEAHRRIVAASAPQDIILMGGGIQNERPLQNSLATRFFLAQEKERTVVSLYDVMQITQPEFWGTPIPSVQALQAQIDAGRRVWFPGFLQAEFEAAEHSGLVQMQVRAHGDDVFEVTSVRVPAR